MPRGAWSVEVDDGVKVILDSIVAGMADRTKLHERWVIRAQSMSFRMWPKAPPLTSLTIRARRRGGSDVLLDRGILRLSIIGRAPGVELSREEGTLAAVDREKGVIGSSLIYAPTHFYGARIVPRRAKVLAVPLTPEASAAGSPRNFPYPLGFIPTKRKTQSIGLLVEKIAKTRKVRGSALSRKDAHGRRVKRVRVAGRRVAHYLLMKWVDIPQRRFMPTDEEFAPEMVKIGERYVKDLAKQESEGTSDGGG